MNKRGDRWGFFFFILLFGFRNFWILTLSGSQNRSLTKLSHQYQTLHKILLSIQNFTENFNLYHRTILHFGDTTKFYMRNIIFLRDMKHFYSSYGRKWFTIIHIKFSFHSHKIRFHLRKISLDFIWEKYHISSYQTVMYQIIKTHRFLQIC